MVCIYNDRTFLRLIAKLKNGLCIAFSPKKKEKVKLDGLITTAMRTQRLFTYPKTF